MKFDGITLTQAAQESPVSTQTLRRWIESGIDLRGQRVRLEAIRYGGRFLVQRDALDNFLARLNVGTR